MRFRLIHATRGLEIDRACAEAVDPDEIKRTQLRAERKGHFEVT